MQPKWELLALPILHHCLSQSLLALCLRLIIGSERECDLGVGGTFQSVIQNLPSGVGLVIVSKPIKIIITSDEFLTAFLRNAIKFSINLRFLASLMKLALTLHFTPFKTSILLRFSSILFSNQDMKFIVIEISRSLFATS